jgi:heme exporter protein A
VHVWRGDRHVLKGVSLSLRPRQLLHVAGPNGTGKTTLLRVACGLLRPEQGQVAWQGKPISSTRIEYQAALAYASHEPALKGDLTALENLRFTVGLKRRVTATELRAALAKHRRRGMCRPAGARSIGRSAAARRHGTRAGDERDSVAAG